MKIIARFIAEKGDNTAISNMIRQDGVWHTDAGNIVSSGIKSVTVLDTLTGSELEMSLLDLSQEELVENNIDFNIRSEISEYKLHIYSRRTLHHNYCHLLIILGNKDNLFHTVTYSNKLLYTH